jgi:hypothetical protein
VLRLWHPCEFLAALDVGGDPALAGPVDALRIVDTAIDILELPMIGKSRISARLASFSRKWPKEARVLAGFDPDRASLRAGTCWLGLIPRGKIAFTNLRSPASEILTLPTRTKAKVAPKIKSWMLGSDPQCSANTQAERREGRQRNP